jgi:hypothetical protein
MPDATESRKNTAPRWGLFFALASIGCNAVFFLVPPGQGAIAWVSLLLSVVALIFIVAGLRLVIVHSKVYRGNTLNIAVNVIAVLLAGLSVFGFVSTRKLPSAAEAPQIGQKVPDFTLADTSGKPVSLDQLLAPSPTNQAPARKGVLLIFYRGYW